MFRSGWIDGRKLVVVTFLALSALGGESLAENSGHTGEKGQVGHPLGDTAPAPARCVPRIDRDPRLILGAEWTPRVKALVDALATARKKVEASPLIANPATVAAPDRAKMVDMSVGDLMTWSLYFREVGTEKEGADKLATFVDALIAAKTTARKFPPVTNQRRIDWDAIRGSSENLEKLAALVAEPKDDYGNLAIESERLLRAMDARTEAQMAVEKGRANFPFRFDYVAPTADEKIRLEAEEARFICEFPRQALAVNQIGNAVLKFTGSHGLPVKLRAKLREAPSEVIDELARLSTDPNADFAQALTAALYRVDFAKLEGRLDEPTNFEEAYLGVLMLAREYRGLTTRLAASPPTTADERVEQGKQKRELGAKLHGAIARAIAMLVPRTSSQKAREHLEAIDVQVRLYADNEPARAAVEAESLAKRLGKTPTGISAANTLLAAYEVLAKTTEPSPEFEARRERARQVAESVVSHDGWGPTLAGDDDASLRAMRMSLGKSLFAAAEKAREEKGESRPLYERAAKLFSRIDPRSPDFIRARWALYQTYQNDGSDDAKARIVPTLLELPPVPPPNIDGETARQFFEGKAALARRVLERNATPETLAALDLAKLVAAIDASKMSDVNKNAFKAFFQERLAPWAKVTKIRELLAANKAGETQADAEALLDLGQQDKLKDPSILATALRATLLRSPAETADRFIKEGWEKKREMGKEFLDQVREHMQQLAAKGPSAAKELSDTHDAYEDFLVRIDRQYPSTIAHLQGYDRNLYKGLMNAYIGNHEKAASLLAEYPKPTMELKNGTEAQKSEAARRHEMHLMRVRELRLAGQFELALGLADQMLGNGGQETADYPRGFARNELPTIMERAEIIEARALAAPAEGRKTKLIAALNEWTDVRKRINTTYGNQGSWGGKLDLQWNIVVMRRTQVIHEIFPSFAPDAPVPSEKEQSVIDIHGRDFAVLDFRHATRDVAEPLGTVGWDKELRPIRDTLTRGDSRIRQAYLKGKAELVAEVVTGKRTHAKANEWAAAALIELDDASSADAKLGWHGMTRAQFEAALPKEGPVRARYEELRALTPRR